ncbi:MAG: LPS assembly protein LptD [Gammaproteobacteria bacterium]|nr:LPS assembly protein LptD [Gammaproteobacteria bacterium]
MSCNINIATTIKNKSASLIYFKYTAYSLGLMFYCGIAFSQTNTNCPVQNDSVIHQPPPVFAKEDLGKINISADQTRSESKGTSTFLGNVIIEKHELRITADKAAYDANTDSINIDGNVHVDTSNIAIDADLGRISKEKQSSFFEGVAFQIGQQNMRGKAASISASKADNTELNDTSITSCNQEDPDWSLNADNISLNYEEEYGSAEDVTLQFMGVPFLYVPYMEFPIGDRRRSGLLVPELGYSSSRGSELSIPWYWNIAPNHDAVLAPHSMSKRGVQLDTQYRFLTEISHGQMDASFLNNDKITDESRHQFQYRQYTRFSSDLNMAIDVQDVSDMEYFNDFSNNLSTSSTTHLNRNILLNYNKKHWRSSLLAQTFETLDSTILNPDRPYRRLPELNLQGDQPLTDNGLAFTLDAQWTSFDHEDDSVITGSRFQFKPGLHWLAEGSFWFIDPAIKFSHTQYEVEDANGVKQDIENRNLSTSSLDAGLFFEKELNDQLIQTLEPRIYYLNVPYRDQSLLPVFDTQLSIFSSSLLFRDNRFNGGDRIGDANQLTLALSSRLISSDSGHEFLRASIGQISYFEDRLVSLNGTVESNNKSDLIAELAANLNNWSMSASTQWNTDNNQSQRGNFLLHYQSDSQHIFNLGLRHDRSFNNEIRQTDLSFMAPINNEFSAFGRWNYSLEHDRDIEAIAGISYDSCCWSVQLMAQRSLKFNNTIEEYDNAIMVQLVLKGLGSVSGNKVSDALEHHILGYNEEQ